MLNTCLALCLMVAPLVAGTSVTTHTQEQTAASHQHIQGEALKTWYDQNKEMVVLDARSQPYYDGTLLPNAKWLSWESSEQAIEAAVPSKETLIVVYCAGTQCPASGFLNDKLTAMGYTNVYEYSEGLQDWLTKGFPTAKQ